MCARLCTHTYTVSVVISDGRVIFSGFGFPERFPWLMENEKLRASLSPRSAPPGWTCHDCLPEFQVDRTVTQNQVPLQSPGPHIAYTGMDALKFTLTNML